MHSPLASASFVTRSSSDCGGKKKGGGGERSERPGRSMVLNKRKNFPSSNALSTSIASKARKSLPYLASNQINGTIQILELIVETEEKVIRKPVYNVSLKYQDDTEAMIFFIFCNEPASCKCLSRSVDWVPNSGRHKIPYVYISVCLVPPILPAKKGLGWVIPRGPCRYVGLPGGEGRQDRLPYVSRERNMQVFDNIHHGHIVLICHGTWINSKGRSYSTGLKLIQNKVQSTLKCIVFESSPPFATCIVSNCIDDH